MEVTVDTNLDPIADVREVEFKTVNQIFEHLSFT